MIITPRLDIADKFNNVFIRAIREAETRQKVDKQRLVNLRCSQLPFCGLSLFVKLADNIKYSRLDFLGTYYTSVGTTVHEVMQTLIPTASKNVIGNWKCVRCNKVHEFTSYGKCCGLPMRYIEVSVNYKGIQGHIDLLYKINKELVVVDFKTTSLAGKDKKAKNPGNAYIDQIKTYIYLLRKQYKIKVNKAMLVFIPRDDPTKPTYFQLKVSKEELENIGIKLKKSKKAHKRILNLTTSKELKEYINEFGFCDNEYCKVCKAKNVNRILKEAFVRLKDKNRLPLIDAI